MAARARAARSRRRQWSGLWFVLPGLVLYGTFLLYPAARTINLSFWDWDGVNAATWVGGANYADVFTDQVLRGSLVHAFILIAFFSLLPVCLGLLMAALLTRRRIRGMAAFRLVFFLPQILPLVAIGIVWRWIYSPRGLANELLGLVGIASERAWLGEWDWALPAIGLIGAWVQSGLCMMLFVAGAGRIDRSLYEAARLDGAGAVREFFAVTLPGLRREIALALTVTVISALASFDIVYVATGGSPGHQTDVPGLLVYQRLLAGDLGHAAALAVVLSCVVVLAAAATNRLARAEDR
jgi:raffinose/stachyose/melibiose transport system permease protein